MLDKNTKTYKTGEISKYELNVTKIDEIRKIEDNPDIKKPSIIDKINELKKQERLDTLKKLGLENNYCAKNIISDITRELNA